MRRDDTHLAFLDSFRGFAILSVFLFHCYAATYGLEQSWNGLFLDFSRAPSLLFFPLTFGWVGVPVFFVISGFCIHLSHQRSNHKDFYIFFIRRFFRIYPPYFVALLVCSLFLVKFGSFSELVQIASHVLLIQNFYGQFIYGINASFWSIAIEVQLYLLYPLLCFVGRRLSWTTVLWMTGSIEVGLRIFSVLYATARDVPLSVTCTPAILATCSPFYFWFGWSLGAAAAEAFIAGKALPFSGVPVWVFPSLTLVALLVKPLVSFVFLLAALSTVSFVNLFLATSGNSRPVRPPFVERHLRLAGLASYSMYLLHQPLLSFFVALLTGTYFHLPPAMDVALCIVAWFPVLLISRLFCRFIELPCIELGKKMIQWHLSRFSAIKQVVIKV